MYTIAFLILFPHLVEGDLPPGVGSLSGTVSDSTSGEFLSGARLQLFRDSLGNDAAEPYRTVIANDSGVFSFIDVPPGRYHLIVRTLGYRTADLALDIPEDTSPMYVQVRVHQHNIPLGEVVVEGERSLRKETTLDAIPVQPGIARKIPSLGGEPDILRTLQFLPGIKAASEVSGGLYVRGSSPDHNLTLLDGASILNPAHMGGFLSMFDSDMLGDVRLVKGALPARYGGRAASVLDVAMRSGRKDRVGGSAGLSMLASRLMLEGPLSDNVTFMVSGRRLYADLLLPLFTTDEKVPSYYFYDVSGKVSYAPSNDDRIFVSGYSGHDVLNRSAVNEDASFDIDWGNSTVSGQWVHTAHPGLSTTLALLYSQYAFTSAIKSSPESGYQDYRSSSTVSDVTVRGEARYAAGQGHSLRGGGELVWNTYGASAIDRVAEMLRSYYPPTTRRAIDASAFLQDDWRVFRPVTLHAGVRWNVMQDGTFHDLEPRFSLTYDLSDDVSFKSAYAVAHQYLHLIVRNDISFPTDFWLRSVGGLSPSQTRQVSFGVEINTHDRFYLLTLEAYHKNMSNLLEYSESAELSAGVPSVENFTSGTGEAYGAELFLQKREGAWTGSIAYTLAWTTRTFAELNGGRTFFPRHDRRHDLAVAFMHNLSVRWELGATWVYGTGQTYTLPAGVYYYPPRSNDGRYYLDYPERNGYRLPPFHKLDVNITHTFEWFALPFRLSLNVYNLYNRQNPFARYIRYERQEIQGTTLTRNVPSLKQLTLFPILPTLGLSCTF